MAEHDCGRTGASFERVGVPPPGNADGFEKKGVTCKVMKRKGLQVEKSERLKAEKVRTLPPPAEMRKSGR